ncbi:MAG TPA: thioredoxin domain-containing protein, partial [Gemmatales bacterium]|nr:thioredoxin domain-containing protein [Gemmatales bacterium]
AEHAQAQGKSGTLSEQLLKQAGRQLSQAYDVRYGGFGRAPKFPHPLDLKLLLRLYPRYQDADALQMATHTLEQMARGGMYDQLAGGFHRYSTDERWLVPHFEKMLYDNALLVPVYLEAWQATRHRYFLRIVEETLGWVTREMTSPAGGFYSTTDADSEGVEGKYFVWTLEEVQTLLQEDAEFASALFDITPTGNWEGHTILTRPKSDLQEMALRSMEEEAYFRQLESIRHRLLEAREKRIKPGRDEKILTAWNGLMIAAYAQASLILGRPAYLEQARAAARYVLTYMRQPDGRLFRTSLAGGPARLNAYLEDYAFLIDGLLHLAEASFEQRWLAAALELAEIMIDQFWDNSSAGFFFVGHDHEKLILREKQASDNATPSGNSMAATVLLKLSHLTGHSRYRERAEQTLLHFAGSMEQHPLAYGQMLVALDDYLGPVEEYALLAGEHLQEVRKYLYQKHLPRKVVVGPPLATPLLEGRENRQALPVVYRCQGHTCDAPWVGLEAIASALSE